VRSAGGHPHAHRREDPHQPRQRDRQAGHGEANPGLRPPPAQGAHQAGRHPRLVRHSVPGEAVPEQQGPPLRTSAIKVKKNPWGRRPNNYKDTKPSTVCRLYWCLREYL
jgi:hypothetical protein